MKKNRAFTLIELLIAVSIFSIVILTVYSAFQTGILSYRKVDSAFETYQTLRSALNRMESDLKNSFAYDNAEDSGFSGTKDSLDFFSIVDYYREDKINTDVCRVRYAWDENEKALKRTCYIGPDALKTDIPENGAELAPNIEKIILEYAYPTQEEGGSSFKWQDSWPIKKDEYDLTQQKNLPLAVKITLFTTEKEGSEEKPVFNKIIPLPLGKTAPAEG